MSWFAFALGVRVKALVLVALLLAASGQAFAQESLSRAKAVNAGAVEAVSYVFDDPHPGKEGKAVLFHCSLCGEGFLETHAQFHASWTKDDGKSETKETSWMTGSAPRGEKEVEMLREFTRNGHVGQDSDLPGSSRVGILPHKPMSNLLEVLPAQQTVVERGSDQRAGDAALFESAQVLQAAHASAGNHSQSWVGRA